MLSDQETARRKRERLLNKAREYQVSTYKNKFAAPVFQLMIRAEAAVLPYGNTPAIIGGQVRHTLRLPGQCVCVTCGKVGPWKGDSWGGGSIETGHFLASRANSIVFEESNAHPQCKHCNRHLDGNQANYELWMQFVYGPDEPDRLRQLKRTTISFSREDLVDRRIEYDRRLKAAMALLDTEGQTD